MNKKIQIRSLIHILCLFALILPDQKLLNSETILIKNGKIFPITSKPIRDGFLLIQNHKIAKISTKLEDDIPAGAKVIDATGMYIYPGMIGLMTSIGVTGYPGAGNDQNETGVFTPHMDPYDALNPEDNTIEVTRIGGVTTVQTTSGSQNVFSGKSIVIDLAGNIPSEMILIRNSGQIINTAAKRENQFPSTTPGTIAMIRDKLNNARSYMENQKKSPKQEEKSSAPYTENSKIDLEMEALIPIITGETKTIFITSDEISLRNALNMISEYKLNGIIVASRGIHKYLDQLAQHKIPVIWGGTTTVPDRWEPYDLYYRTASQLAEKNILFAFISGGFGGGSYNVRNLPVPAALSVAHGLKEEEAIKALTIKGENI